MDKVTSNRIKGVAIILMIMTHVLSLFTINSNFFVIPLFNNSITLETIIGRSADICIYLFAFITGYGLCFAMHKSTKELILYLLKKIITFLLCYWLVIFVVFLPFYWVYQGGNFKFIELIKTMFGHHGFFSYGWYVYFYLLVLITLPFFSKLLNINKWLSILISYVPFLLAYFLLNRFQAKIPYYDILCILLFAYSATSIGYSFAKHSLFDFLLKIFRNKKWLILITTSIIGFGLQILVFGYFGKAFIQSFTVVPIITFLVVLLSFNTPKFISKPLDILGNNSMNIWYIHYIFFCQYIVCFIHTDSWILFSKIGIFAVILATIFSLIISTPFTLINQKIIKEKISKSI